MAGERLGFWLELKAKWPADTDEAVFLARVIHVLGKRRFPDEWTSHDPLVDSAQSSFHSINRFEAVISEIQRACAFGHLITQLQTASTGELEPPLPASVWITTKWRPRFIRCRMDEFYPFEEGFARIDHPWIFVTRTSFEAYLSPTIDGETQTTLDTPQATPPQTVLENSKTRRAMAEYVATNDRNLFWARPDLWPSDGPNALFLANAVHRIAEKKVDEWTGKEPALSIQITEPTLAEGCKELTHRLIVSVSTRNLPQAELRSARERFQQIKNLMVETLLTGELIAVSRPLEGGAFSAPLPPAIWQTERNEFRFALCQINPADPYGDSFAGKDCQWIFLTKDSLEAYLSNGTKPPAVDEREVLKVATQKFSEFVTDLWTQWASGATLDLPNEKDDFARIDEWTAPHKLGDHKKREIRSVARNLGFDDTNYFKRRSKPHNKDEV